MLYAPLLNIAKDSPYKHVEFAILADTIVLGCTHYPFFRALIEDLVGKDVVLIDTGVAVAKHLKHRLQENQLLSIADELGDVSFWSNNEAVDAEKVMSALWGDEIKLKRLP